MGSEIRRIVSRIQALVDRNRHRCVVDVLEFRIASFVDRSDPLAVSGSVDLLADPFPGASGSERSDASGITSGSSIDAMIRPGWRTSWPTTLFTFLNIYGEHTLEPLRPQKNSGSSNKPLVSGSLVLLPVSEEQRLYAVYCWARTPHGVLLDSPVVWVPTPPDAP